MSDSRHIMLMYISNNSGHHRAARAIEESLNLSFPNIRTLNINCFNYTNPILEKVINSIYNKVIKVKPEVWEYLYDNPKILKRTRKLRSLIHKFNSKKLKRLIEKFNPQAIVCTQAFPCGMVADFKKTYGLDIPLVGVLTDYAPHSYWIYGNVDSYVVPNEETKEKFIKGGISDNRICPYGIPISPKFGVKHDRAHVLVSLRLDPAVPTLLLMGGGQGLGPIEDLTYAVNTLEEDFQVIIVCGTNMKLRRWLENRRRLFRKRMAVVGYTREIERLMDAADIIVTKPGGLTTAEALTKGLPIVIVNPIPGQEAMNTRFLLKEGVAVKAGDPLEAAALIGDLWRNPDKLSSMRQAALKHAHPLSAERIARLVTDILNRNSQC